MAFDPAGLEDAPGVDQLTDKQRGRLSRAEQYAAHILETCADFLPAPPAELDVLDVGSGFGHTASALARACRHVVGLEPSETLCRHARDLQTARNQSNLEIRHARIEDLDDEQRYDLVVLDNVLEHLPDQPLALRRIVRALRDGGALYILVPNKLWPVEVHHNLPFLSYLPLPLANLYLRATRKGTDYTPASYAPTYFRLNRLLRDTGALAPRYVLPARIERAAGGDSLLYRAGVAAIRWFPPLWMISKALLVVAVKR